MIKISAGGYFSMGLTNSNKIYTWGTLFYYVSGIVTPLGTGDNTANQRYLPTLLSTASGTALNGKTIQDIKAGPAVAFVLSTDGTVCGLGYNFYSQVLKFNIFNTTEWRWYYR
jgi:hypothetical protein